MNTTNREEIAAVRDKCDLYLSRHRRRTTSEWLRHLSESSYAQWPLDQYGHGKLAAELESRVGKLLGKPAAVFMPKGTIAQQIALKIWAERRDNTSVAIHPQSHMALDESDALSALSGLHPVLVGGLNETMTLHDLATAADEVGTVVIELPLRRAGFKLPSWAELRKIFEWAGSREIAVHLDGARLWESSEHYALNYAEIAAPFDSVYVSLYKGLGAMAGCVLAGPQDFVDETRDWQNRFGGLLYTAAPYLIGGLEGLDHYLPLMPHFVQAARKLAIALEAHSQLSLTPDPPQTNSFQVVFQQPADVIWDRCLARAEHKGIWLFDVIQGMSEAVCMGEVQLGETCLAESIPFWANEVATLTSD